MMMTMPNNDLISRNAAINAVYYKPNYKMAIEVLKEVPAVDAAPVVHGRWEFCGDDDIVCSVCGARYLKKRLLQSYYTGVGSDKMNGFWHCPHCGALLDGKENDPD